MMNVGSIEVVEQQGLTKMPQEAASAWSSFDGSMGLYGRAGYKPISYVGKQIVKGVNHVFIAEQTLIIAEPVRHIVIVKINNFDGKYSIAGIEQII